jgi:Pyridine nucleotide-disulphide oxidoreductase
VPRESRCTSARRSRHKAERKYREGHPRHRDVIAADRLLMAVGPQPVIDGLILQNARVLVDQRGRIVTDRHLATSAPGVYAAGDMTGLMPFTTPPTPWAGGRSWPATSSSAGCCTWACRLPPVWRSPSCCTAAALRATSAVQPCRLRDRRRRGRRAAVCDHHVRDRPAVEHQDRELHPAGSRSSSATCSSAPRWRVGVLETQARPLQRPGNRPQCRWRPGDPPRSLGPAGLAHSAIRQPSQ